MRLPSGLETGLVTRYDDARTALADPRLSKALPAHLRIIDAFAFPLPIRAR